MATHVAGHIKVLAVSSSGGHWEQLMLLREAFSGADVVYATTLDGLAKKSQVGPAYLITDCNRDRLSPNVRCVRELFHIIRTERPDVILSTGAAPGLIAIAVGKLFGAKGVWIDSVANSEKLSLSGKMAGRLANLWLTQWPQLARSNGPHYFGAVL